MNDHHDHPDPTLERFLDGALPPAERRSFLRRLDEEHALQEEVQLQQRIDASLRRAFTPPAAVMPQGNGHRPAPLQVAPPLDTEPDVGSDRTVRRRFTVARTLALAAAVVFSAAGLWQVWLALRPSPQAGYGLPWTSFRTVYAEVDSGTLDYWQCADDAEFADTFRQQLGQPLVLAALPDGARALGLAYCHSLSRRTICLVGEVDERRVIVLVDRLETDRPQARPNALLNLFRREVGRLVLYEITPHDQPALLDRLDVPERQDPGADAGEIEP